MTLQELLKITNAIKSMNNAELNQIVRAVNDARSRKNVLAAAEFNIGDKVSFGRPNGRQRIGIVSKINIKKALINVSGASWRVPFSLMRKVA